MMLTKTTPKSTAPHTTVRPALHYAGISPRPSTACRLALIDSQGNIVAVNKDWMALAEQTGAELNRIGPGTNYLEVCRQASALCPDSRRALAGIQGVLKQRRSSFAMDYICDTSCGLVSFRMDVTAIAFKSARAVISHTELTEPNPSNENLTLLQQFAGRLIHAQEEERQRISLEIHDDLANQVALMAMSIRRHIEQPKERSASGGNDLHRVLDEISTLASSLRDLSHGLQPPLLRYAGIRPALKWLCEKFESANDVDLDVVIPEELPRFHPTKELCIFRVAQESLQNIVKHSRADKVRIVLDCQPHQVQLTISDNGRGFIRSATIDQRGLGLLSMEARALCVRGHLVVTSSPGVGTTIRFSIPRQEELG